MCARFPALSTDVAFAQMKLNIEKGINVNFVTTYPLTGKRLNIKGYVPEDCYVFIGAMLPAKDELMSELRKFLSRRP